MAIKGKLLNPPAVVSRGRRETVIAGRVVDEEQLKWHSDLVDRVSYGRLFDPTKKARNMM